MTKEKNLVVLIDMRKEEYTRDLVNFFGPVYLYDPSNEQILKEHWQGVRRENNSPIYKISYSVVIDEDEIEKVKEIVNKGSIPKETKSSGILNYPYLWTTIEKITVNIAELEGKLEDWEKLQNNEEEIKKIFFKLEDSWDITYWKRKESH